jgi:hypothetical protein
VAMDYAGAGPLSTATTRTSASACMRTRLRGSTTAGDAIIPISGQPSFVSIQSAIADQISPSHSGLTMCLWLHEIGASETVPLT